MRKLLFLFVLLLSSIGMSAQTFEVDGIKYYVLTTSPDYTVSVIGYNSSYEGDLVLNGTVIYNDQTYKVVEVQQRAFGGFSTAAGALNLKRINSLPYCTSIGAEAFKNCYNLTDVGDMSACISIGDDAFSDTSYSNTYGSSLTSIGDLSACASIGNRAFKNCYRLANTIDLSACTSIGSEAFTNCPLESVTLPTTPPTVTAEFSNAGTTFLVPATAVSTYRAANIWSDIKMQIISTDEQHTWNVQAPVLNSIGAAQFENVISLTVSGNIDSDDIMYMRNKMYNLHHLDLTNATFVASDKEFMTGKTTEDNVVDGFKNDKRLRTVKLPTSAKRIATQAFYYSYLYDVVIPEGIETIGYQAFYQCKGLTALQLPEGIKSISSEAFRNCSKLQAVAFPTTLVSIGSSAFQNCRLASISLPESLNIIYDYGFCYNQDLTELHIPSSLESIGAQAFEGCNNLKDVYTYTVQPININSNTFSTSTYAAATLYVPTQGYNDYYVCPTWGQFQLAEFDEPYKYFYISDDFVLLSGKRFDTPEGEDLDVKANAGSSITIEGETNQAVGNIDIYDDGNMGASIIPDNNLTAKTVTFHLQVGARTWRFFCFPFRVQLSNVQAPGSYVFRRYNGDARALGNTGWESLPVETEYLEAGVGYIYQCNNAGTLKITVSLPDFSWATSTKTNTLTAHAAANDQDASWNFVGNPLTSYYDIDDMQYESPLTVWDGTKYVAYRADDDNYQLRPFEAFFVQKPNDSSVPTYDKSKRMGHNAAEKVHSNKAAAARRRAPGNRDRYLLNLVLSNGEQQDQTRVVFNEKKTTAYERECDAAKFMSMEQVPQLYTVDHQVNYAINERQQGSVQVGFIAPEAGSYTLKAERMDMDVVLKDAVTGTTFDLKNGEYTFESEAGTFNTRFLLMPAGDETGIKDITSDKTDSPAYTLDGRQLPKGKTAKGIIIENGKKVVK